MRGRKPTPPGLKLLAGNPGKRPVMIAPAAPGLSPRCPAELEDPIARDEWRRTIAPAIASGHITITDRALALAHCELYAQWRSLLAAAARDGDVIAMGRNRRPLPNPARILANKTIVVLAGIDEKLGFSPTARGRVSLATPPPPVPRPPRPRDPQRERFHSTERG